MTDFNDAMEQPESTNRPRGLHTLCILTFVYTGLGFISNIGRFFGGPESTEKMEEQRIQSQKTIELFTENGMNYFAELLDKLSKMADALNFHFYENAVVSLFHVLLGAAAAYLVFKGRKLGFHLYIIYSLLSVAQLYLFVSPSIVPFTVVLFDLLFSGIFVFLYSRHLHWLK